MQYDHFLELAYTLVRIRDLNQLLETVLQRLRDMLACDAGSIYIYDSETNELIFKFTQNDSVRLPFKEFSIPVNKNSIAGYVALTKRSIRISDVYKLDRSFPFKFNSNFDRMSSYRTKSMLVFPVTDINNELTGVLQFINKKRTGIPVALNNVDKLVIPFTQDDEKIARSLVGIVSLALENGMLYSSIENMWESFISASVMAIESRDPITSGHTNRVTTLSMILAQEMAKDKTSFPNFELSKTDMKLLKYACLLHDFGKIGVREHVLQKAEKLSDGRIDVIRGRIHLAKAMAVIEKRGDEELKKLDAYHECIKKSNIPTFLESDTAEMLREISEYRFHDIDDREHKILDELDYRQLSIRRGSLTEPERREVESHVKYTYEFLRSIPWTKELKDLPSIAAQHHEKLNGSGYPFGLKGDEIHIFGRIMAVVDMFDALTARDRPYKEPMNAEDACKILRQEALEGVLDNDIVEFFIINHLYRRV